MNFRFLRYLLPLVLLVNSWSSFQMQGWHTWRTFFFSFGIIPFIEFCWKPSERNLTAAEEEIARKDKRYDYLLYAVLPLQYITLGWWLFSLQQPQNGPELTGRILSMGILCGIFGINVAHELGHRNDAMSQWMARMLLMTSLYTHFFIEHNKGHHRHVSTPLDPSSSPAGYSLYRFWFRSLPGTFMSAWRISAEELTRRGDSPWSWNNEMLRWQVYQAMLLSSIWIFFGGWTVACFAAAALTGALLLESVNYIEHYGLRRKHGTDGQWEKVAPYHSWNSNHPLGRLMLFELSRHSDHHFMSSRKYQVLRHHEQAPQLPAGYPGSILLAFVPPIWFRIMDKKLQKLSGEAKEQIVPDKEKLIMVS